MTGGKVPGAQEGKPISAVTYTSSEPLFPTRIKCESKDGEGEDSKRRQLSECEGGSAKQAGASVSFSLFQEGGKLQVENLEEPVQISVPVSSESELKASCVGQPNALSLLNDLSSNGTGCLDALECRYWDHNASAWSTEGCTTTQYNESGQVAVGCSCNHLSDFVAIKVPTSLRGLLDLAIVNVPEESEEKMLNMDASIIPGDKHVALVKDGATALVSTVTMRLSFNADGDDALSHWRLLSVKCNVNSTAGCATPVVDAVGAWEPLRPSLSSRNASEDVLLHLNASGLPEDPTAAAYVTEVQMEVISLTGAARVHTLGIAASVTAEAVATASGWGTVEPHGRCSESELALVAQEVGGSAVVVAEVGRDVPLPLSLCDFEGLAVARGVPRPSDLRRVTAELAYLMPGENATAAVHLTSTEVVGLAMAHYTGGALYHVNLPLPKLGVFRVSAYLGDEPLGVPLLLVGACPMPLMIMADGENCGCPPGSEGGGTTGDITCSPCAAGTASVVVGSRCEPCDVATYSQDGANACLACPRGKYNNRLMAAECKACAPGYYSAPGATRCERCGLNDPIQRTADLRGQDETPTSSPYGLDCSDGVVGAIDENGTVTGVLPEYWAAEPVDEFNANETRVWACETPGVCLGGANSTCREGHTGVLCVDCLDGYTRRVGRLCEPFVFEDADVALGAAMLAFGTALFAAVFGLCLTLLCCRIARPAKKPPKPPWEEEGGETVAARAPKGADAFDVWIHREADQLLEFNFSESVVEDLRKFGIDARIERGVSSGSSAEASKTGTECSVSVRVLRANNLVAADKDTSDPYVVVHAASKWWGGKQVKTSVKKGTVNPVWNETLELGVVDAAAPLSVEVWDHDKLSMNDSLGSAEIKLDQCEPGEPTPVRIALSTQGTVHLVVTITKTAPGNQEASSHTFGQVDHVMDSAKHALQEASHSMHHLEHQISDGLHRARHDSLSIKGMQEWSWKGMQMALRIQRTFRRGRRGKKGGTKDVPEGDIENAAVCLFVLSPNFFQDERSLALISRAVELKKHCELIVMPKAKFGPERDKPFPENVFNPAWKPYLPKLGPAFRTIAINWEVEYQPACLQMAVERVAPLITTKLDLGRARLRCTELENEELAKAAAWKPKEMTLEWKWEEKVFDVFLSHKITDAKDIVLSWCKPRCGSRTSQTWRAGA